MTLIAIDILICVAIDETTMHAAVRMQINHKVYLIGLEQQQVINIITIIIIIAIINLRLNYPTPLVHF